MNFYLFLNFSKIKNIRSEIIYKKIEKTIKTSKQRIKEPQEVLLEKVEEKLNFFSKIKF